MKRSHVQAILLGLIALSLPACQMHEAKAEPEEQKVVVTTPKVEDVTITQRYVCQIHSQQHIELHALEEGYLEQITVKEGQAVKKGEVLFKVIPTLYQAKWDAESAEARLAELELKFTQGLADKNVVSPNEVALYKAKLARAQAKADLAKAEFNFTEVKAPFDGIIDRLYQQQGSLVKKEDLLTTLSDNSVMWVYYNVPEARYLEYMASQDQQKESRQIELVLANGSKYPYHSTNVTVEGQFNNETGNIAFRADFPNPERPNGGRLLRHGQTGNVLIHRPLKNALIIPLRATFEILDKRFVYVVGEDHVLHLRQITVQHELEDIFVIESGLTVNDKIVLEGARQLHDVPKLEEYEFRTPEEALKNLKYHAE